MIYEIAIILVLGGGFVGFCFFKAFESSNDMKRNSASKYSFERAFVSTIKRVASERSVDESDIGLCYAFRGIKQAGTDRYVTINNASAYGVIFDDNNRELVILSQAVAGLAKNPSYDKNVTVISYPYSLFLKYECKINDSQIHKPDIMGALGGAIVGGFIGGGAGAIIGGTTMSSGSTNKNYKKIEIQITLNNLSMPVANIVLLDEQVAISDTHPKYIEALKGLSRFANKLEVILHSNKEGGA